MHSVKDNSGANALEPGLNWPALLAASLAK